MGIEGWAKKTGNPRGISATMPSLQKASQDFRIICIFINATVSDLNKINVHFKFGKQD